MNTITPTHHSSVVGGSTAARVLACPASVKLVQRMPEQATSEAAAEGTAMHQAIEHAITEGLFVGELREALLDKVFNGIAITQVHIDELLAPALGAFHDLLDELTEDDAAGDMDAVQFYLEIEVGLPGIEGAFGTADVVIVTPERMVVFDWKFGRGLPVSARDNNQLKFYAAGALYMGEMGTAPYALPAEGHGDFPIELVICQPAGVMDDGGCLSRWVTTGDVLVRFVDALKGAVAEAMGDDPSYHRGEHCRWCTGKPVCPLYRDLGDKLGALKDRIAAGGVSLSPDDPVDRIDFTPEELLELSQKADIAATWVKGVRALIEERAHAGVILAGHKIIEKRGNTAYLTATPKQTDALLAKRGLSAAERRKPWQPITPTQANAVLKAKGLPLLVPHTDTHRPIIGTSIVPLDHPAPAVMVGQAKARAVGDALRNLSPDRGE